MTSVKQLLLTLSFSLTGLCAQAATISVGNINDIHVADRLLGISGSAACETVQNSSNCDFLAPNPTTYLNAAGVASIVTADPSSYVLSPFRNSAYMDLGFSDGAIYNGDGNDAVVFIVGNTTAFQLQAYDQADRLLFDQRYDVAQPFFDTDLNRITDWGDTVFDTDGNWMCVGGSDASCTGGTALSAAFFDFGNNIAGDTAITRLRIFIGEDYIGENGTRPRFSMAGGFYTSPAVAPVPLPLPVLLFASGLGLLGWVGRRKRH